MRPFGECPTPRSFYLFTVIFPLSTLMAQNSYQAARRNLFKALCASEAEIAH